MTVTPTKSSLQPASSSFYNSSPRSRRAQMDEADGLKFKFPPDDTVSLASSLAEPINLEEPHYVRLRGELEFDAQNLEAESWSTAVEPSFLKSLTKEAAKRQDVIYELIQTEMHHVRTLKILLYIYLHELRQSQLMEETRLEQLFPGVDELLCLHQSFFNCLKARQIQSQEEEGPTTYQIRQLGDILTAQFSDALGLKMMECYSIFCGHQSEATCFYKEQLQSNKKLQILNRKLGQLSLVRRLGISECFLLVTQRITKYPVLVERIIQNTEADTDEHKSLLEALERIKDIISQVNAQVSEYEKAARLREICLRLEPKSQGRLKGGRLLRREDLLQGNRRLLHEGDVTWKSSGRQKDIHAVLLSDMILLLQEKDQKLVFAAVDNKPPVISLSKLIVREVAHDDKAMFLICDCTSSMPEMYEILTGSREERVTWMALIRDAVEHKPQEEENSELIAKLQECQDALKERDNLIIQCLTEKQLICAQLYERTMVQDTLHKGLLFRGDASELQQGDTLLRGAIDDAEKLLNLIFSWIQDSKSQMDESKQGELLGRAETLGVGDSYTNPMKNGDEADGPVRSDGWPLYVRRNTSDPSLQDRYCSEGPEQSADNDDDDTLPLPDCVSAPTHFPYTEVSDRLLRLMQRLHSLEAVIAQQDSQIELQLAFQSNSQQPSRHYSNVLLEQERQRNLEKQKEELANLHKLQAQQREEQQRWEKEWERQRIQIEALGAQLQQREDDCMKREEKLNGEKAELERQWKGYQQDLERLRESTKSVDKERERQSQERERLEQLQEKLKSRWQLLSNQGYANYDDPTQHVNLSSYASFRGSVVNGGGNLTQIPNPSNLLNTSNPMEIPPKVPPRKESIASQSVKPEMPIHLISTTNQVNKPPVVQQQIPTKLATLGKAKEKSSKTKGSHQRTRSAANIDVNQVLPIRVTGKEGGSLKAQKRESQQRINQSEMFKPPGSGHNMKPSPSFSAQKRNTTDGPPPVPPPFPKEVLEVGKEKVIFL